MRAVRGEDLGVNEADDGGKQPRGGVAGPPPPGGAVWRSPASGSAGWESTGSVGIRRRGTAPGGTEGREMDPTRGGSVGRAEQSGQGRRGYTGAPQPIAAVAH